MKYDFDEIISRENTSAIKLEKCPKGSIPLWVADMDFACPPEVIEAVRSRAGSNIFGYTLYDDAVKEAVRNWFISRHGVCYEKEWMCYTPGIVTAISFLIEALTKPGDSILIQQPVYHPFKNQIVNNNRIAVSSDLIEDSGRYCMNFADLKEKLSRAEVKGMLLCSPHNPVGRLWTKEELRTAVELAKKYDKFIICDEIHCDLTRVNTVHTPLLTAAEDYKDKIVICTAPSKTFNIAGLQFSNIIIPGEEIRKKYMELCDGRFEISCPNSLSLAAVKAAYESGDKWLDSLKPYLDENIRLVKELLLKSFPKAVISPCEASYLMWVDMSEYLEGGSSPRWIDVCDMMEKTGVYFNDGSMFGKAGKGHIRINIASPRKVLCEALSKMI